MFQKRAIFYTVILLAIGLIPAASLQAQVPSKDSISRKAKTELDSTKKSFQKAAAADVKDNLSKATAKLPTFDSSYSFDKVLKPFKFSLPQKKFGAGGSLSITGYYTDIQNPRSLNEKQYVRINANPRVVLLGLPFTSEIYYTTENNRFYNSNSFSLHFDKDKFVKDLQNQAKKQVAEYKQELFAMGKDLRSQQISTDNLRRELEMQKRHFQMDSVQMQKQLEAAQEKLKAEAEKQARQKLDSFKSTGDAKKDSLLKDSMLVAQQQKLAHLQKEYEQKKADLLAKKQQADSLYRKGKETYEEAVERVQKLKAGYDQAKSYIAKADSISKDPQALLTSMVKDKGAGKLMKTMSSLQKLDVGNISPYYGDYMINAIPARGADLESSQGKWLFKASGGLTMSNLISTTTQGQTHYDRNFGALGVGYKTGLGTVTLSSAYIWDKPQRPQGVVKNALLGLQTDHTFFKNITLQNDVTYSDYTQTYKSGIEVIRNYNGTGSTIKYNMLDRTALYSRISYNAGKFGEIQAGFKQLGSLFQNAATPFMRRDYREIKLGLKEHLFKNKVHLSAYYLKNSDNLRKEKAYTNSTKGMGFQGQTSFSKGPNFAVSYTPFTQGAYHPDSLLRTNNQYSTKTASVNYQKNAGKIKWFTMVAYSDGMLQFGDTGVKMHNRNVQGMLSAFTKKITASVTYSKSFTEGRVDTLNFDMVSSNVQINLGKKISAGVQNQSSWFKNGGYRIYTASTVRINFNKNFQFQLQTGYTWIEKIWNIRKGEGFTGKSQLIIKF